MASVSIQGVQKSFETTHIIKGVDIDIADGEFVILVGPSGCGKSTLLRMVAGLEEISEGEIRIGTRVVNDLLPKERNIAMVFQNYALYPHMTVAQNMGFSLKMQGTPPSEIAQKVDRAAQILDLNQLLDRYPKQLSGGQRQRVAMGRAIVRDPQVFLFDEPLSNLDAKLRVQMRGEIKALHQRLGTTTIYVTHDQVEAMTMADRIVVLNEGRVEQVGAPLELYARPANLFVACFIGSPMMNIFQGTLKDTTFTLADGQTMNVQSAPSRPIGGPVCYGIRPEHFTLADTGLAAEVVVVEPTGSETQVVAKVCGQSITVLFREHISARPGDILHLQVQTKHAHLFDATSGSRLN